MTKCPSCQAWKFAKKEPCINAACILVSERTILSAKFRKSLVMSVTDPRASVVR